MKKAIIIGAGPAGLTAGYELLKNTNYKPIILEETNMIGGISKTINHNGNRIDIGGHRFFSKSEEVNKIWEELMPVQGKNSIDDIILSNNEKKLSKNGPDPEKEDKVMLVRRRVSRIYFLKKFFPYPITLSATTIKNMGFKNTMRAGFGYIWSCIHKLPEDNLENFYINRFGKPLYEMFFEDYTTKLWGVSPKELSADWGSQRVKGLSLWKALKTAITKPFIKNQKVETSLIEEYLYPKKGPGELWEVMADKIKSMGGEIHLNCKVDKIVLKDNDIVAVIAENNGTTKRFEGDIFFSSMPIKDLVTSMGKNVPSNIRDIAEKLPYRDFITVGLLVNKLKIKNETNLKTVGNIVPDCWIYIQERDVKLGRLQIFNNWSPYMVKDFENKVWIGLEYFCNENDELWNMSDKDFINMASDELEKIGIIAKEDILDSIRIKIKKAYPAYFGSYERFDEVKEYLSSINNLWCIGRNGQHRYNNMDHSMLTAIESVRLISKKSQSKETVWSVNTEKEYHEQKD